MAIAITHATSSTIANSSGGGKISSDAWNADHTVTGIESSTYAWTGNHSFTNSIVMAATQGLSDEFGNRVIVVNRTTLYDGGSVAGSSLQNSHLEVRNNYNLGEVQLRAENDSMDHCPLAFVPKGGDSIRFIWNSTAAVYLEAYNEGPGPNGTFLSLTQFSTSAADGDTPGGIEIYGQDVSLVGHKYAGMMCHITDASATTQSGELVIQSRVANVTTDELFVGNGVKVGLAPTGGYKGRGSINISADIYRNSSGYTNPDYALEHYFEGKIEKFADKAGAKDYTGLVPLTCVENKISKNLRLPNMHDDAMGAFERTDKALEKIEEAWLYITQLHKRVKALEDKQEN